MQATEVARLVLMVLIATCALIAFVVNLVIPRNANVWLAPHQFSMHAYEPHISTSMQFTGPFMSQVHVLPSGRGTLLDTSPARHANCSAALFAGDVRHLEKCKMMRSPPMFLGNVTNAWSVLGEQGAFTLTKHIFLIFLVFVIFWASEYALTEHEIMRKYPVVYVRNFVVFVAVVVFVSGMASNVTSNMSSGVALGSVSTAFFFMVVSLFIISCEYAGMNGKRVEFGAPAKDVKEAGPAGDEESQKPDADAVAPVPALNDAQKEHLHRNIYLSYSSLLMFPLLVLFILSQSHAAVVDVHIQLVFFSFIFYSTLDVFQTRTTAVLLCLKHEAAAGPQLSLVKFFVVFAFIACKCFALMPALVLLQTKYGQTGFQAATLWVHYVVLVGFAAADLVHVVMQKLPTDVAKLLCMWVYTGFVFFAMLTVDTPQK